MVYTSHEVVTLILPDTSLQHFRDLLKRRFDYFEDYFSSSQRREVILDLTTQGCLHLFNYLDTNQKPITIPDWLELLIVADHLKLKPFLASQLCYEAEQVYSLLYHTITGRTAIRRFDALDQAHNAFRSLLRLDGDRFIKT